jgi:hypothetical protein
MGQMTWRANDDLLLRVKDQAKRSGRSLNEWVTEVLSAAADPQHAGTEAERIRERLAAAGLLHVPEPSHVTRPSPEPLARARAAASALRPTISEGLLRDRE